MAGGKTTTLILGESGTGKELLARLIHRSGPRQDKTHGGAQLRRPTRDPAGGRALRPREGRLYRGGGRKSGKFELADGGTIFLDEIGEMSPSMQAKLLRVLQEGVFYRIGGNTSISVDVRVISATNRDIAQEVAAGNFREDLYYRMNVVEIRMPPLRERKEDIPLLADYFLEVFKAERGGAKLKISGKALKKMQDYDWPGNIRELRNALERAVVMGNGRDVLPQDLPIGQVKTEAAGIEVGITMEEAINQFKRDFIIQNLAHTGGNRSKAAKIMGIQRTLLVPPDQPLRVEASVIFGSPQRRRGRREKRFDFPRWGKVKSPLGAPSRVERGGR